MGERFRPYNEADYGPLRTIEKENGPEYPPLIEGRPTVSVDLHNIEWKNGDKMMVRELDKPADLVEPLLYRDEKTTTVSAYEVYFQEKGKHPVCLNKLLSPEHNIVIIGANSFWAFDTEMKSGPNRTTIIALDPMQLYREITMAAAFHELGHANLYEGMDDYVFDLFVSGGEKIDEVVKDPRWRLLKEYFLALKVALEDVKRQPVIPKYMRDEEVIKIPNPAFDFIKQATELDYANPDRKKLFYKLQGEARGFEKLVRVFHERMAWAFAFKKAREFDLRFGEKQRRNLAKYASACLGTYAHHRRDKRFTQGMREETRSEGYILDLPPPV